MESISGDVITKDRIAKRDVIMREGTRGGVDFYAPSFLDALLDNQIIDRSQYQLGTIYWGLVNAAFSFMTPQNSVYADVRTEDEGDVHYETVIDIDDPLSLLVILNGRLGRDYQQAIKASCHPHGGKPLIIVQAFGENLLRNAFSALEYHLPIAREEYQKKRENEKNYLQEA